MSFLNSRKSLEEVLSFSCLDKDMGSSSVLRQRWWWAGLPLVPSSDKEGETRLYLLWKFFNILSAGGLLRGRSRRGV